MNAFKKASTVRGAKRTVAALFILTVLSPPTLSQVIDKTNAPSPALQLAASSKEIDTLSARAPNSQEFCASIGVRVHPTTRPVADSLGMTTPYGAIFGRPQPDSPVARAKIESGDVITAINGSPLRSWRDFAPTTSRFAPGDTVYFITYRSRQLIERSVTLGYSKCPHGQRKA
jgi:membrane-associated protease RseP (regulator of RpoE activity)